MIGFSMDNGIHAPAYPGEDILNYKFSLINYYGKALAGQMLSISIYGYRETEKKIYMAVIQQWLEIAGRVFLAWKQSIILDLALQSYVVTKQYTNVFGKTYTHITPLNTRFIFIT